MTKKIWIVLVGESDGEPHLFEVCYSEAEALKIVSSHWTPGPGEDWKWFVDDDGDHVVVEEVEVDLER